MAGAVFLALYFDPSVTVITLGNCIGDELLVLLGYRIVKASPNQAFNCVKGIFWVGNRLAFRWLADQALAFFCKAYH